MLFELRSATSTCISEYLDSYTYSGTSGSSVCFVWILTLACECWQRIFHLSTILFLSIRARQSWITIQRLCQWLWLIAQELLSRLYLLESKFSDAMSLCIMSHFTKLLSLLTPLVLSCVSFSSVGSFVTTTLKHYLSSEDDISSNVPKHSTTSSYRYLYSEKFYRLWVAHFFSL